MRWLFFFLVSTIQAVEFPYVYRSGYYLGRGHTGIATADYEDSLFYNPAGLAQGKGIYKKIVIVSPLFEISGDTRDVIKQAVLQEEDPRAVLRRRTGLPQHLGINNFTGIILRRAAIGVFAHSSNTAMLFKDHKQGALESFVFEGVNDGGLVFGLAHNFGKKFFAGLSGKYLKRYQVKFEAGVAQSASLTELEAEDVAMLGSGFGVDLGLMFRSKGRTPVSLGLTLQDVGNTTLTPDEKTDLAPAERPLQPIKQTLNFGFAVAPGTRSSKFKFNIDFRDLINATRQSFAKKTHIGLELNLREVVGFTSGLNQGYPSFGAYVDIYVFRLDLGFYTEEFGEKPGSRPDRRFYFRISAGV